MGLIVVSGVLKQLGGDPSVVVEAARRIARGDLTVSLDTGGNENSLLASISHMVDR